MDNKTSSFDYTKKVNGTFKDLINTISYALSLENFSLMSKIDMKEKIKERLDKDIEDYVILGACNPTLAYEVIASEIKIGLFLPCNIILYKKFGETYVSVIKPSSYTNIITNKDIERITKLADEKLKRVIDNI